MVSSAGTVFAKDKILARLKFDAHNNAEKTAGVWVDGQYVGYVKELKSDHKLLLLPGKHHITVRQAWYQDFERDVMLDPNKTYTLSLALVKDGPVHVPANPAELRIYAYPVRAAVFVDGQFAGYVEQFNGVAQALLVSPGEHNIRIALPGYQPWDSTMTFSAGQRLKITTRLMKGSITQAGDLVSQNH